jgi:hypothetical protein
VAESLKTPVDLAVTRVARMPVPSVGVTLPDLNANTVQWFPVAIKQSAANVGRLAPGDNGLTRDVDKIVVVIERQVGGVKRARGLPRGEQRRRCR